jgi:hypothetical protein
MAWNVKNYHFILWYMNESIKFLYTTYYFILQYAIGLIFHAEYYQRKIWWISNMPREHGNHISTEYVLENSFIITVYGYIPFEYLHILLMYSCEVAYYTNLDINCRWKPIVSKLNHTEQSQKLFFFVFCEIFMIPKKFSDTLYTS